MVDAFYVGVVDPAAEEAIAQQPRANRGDAWLIAGLLLLFVGVLGSLAGLARWKGQAGAMGVVPLHWPVATSIARTAGRSTVLLFVHPGCPCSRASLHELAEITARSGNRIDAIVVVASVEGFDENARQAVIESARAVAGVRVVEDVANREATRFGALTSGHALVFSPDGVRLYAGGITRARGHEGDNAGLRQALAALSGGAAREPSPVYGCALVDSESP